MGIGEKIKDAFSTVFEQTIGRAIEWLAPSIVTFLKEQFALNSVRTDNIKDEPLRKEIEKFKEKWQNSPVTASDIANDLMDIVAGQLAEFQFEALTGIDVDNETTYLKRIFTQIGIIKSIASVSSVMAIVGEFVPTTMCGKIGEELRAQLDYAGLTQITGFGYGQMLAAALSPSILREVNENLQHTLLDPSRLQILYQRGRIPSEVYLKEMEKHGYSNGRAMEFDSAADFYPGAQDFVRFAVREVFNDVVAARGGYDEGLPPAIFEHARKAGVSHEVIKWYWRAHWNVPSPTLAFEMLHRGEINEAELRNLLKIADYAPGYIDNMIAVAHNPYTRVDARRMYETGVLDESEYIRSLLDLGYDQDKAEKVAQWAKLRRGGAEKDLTRTMVLQAYTYGLTTSDEALKYIQSLGYDEDESKLIIALEDEKNYQAHVRDELASIRIRYAKGVINQSEVLGEITALGLPQKTAEAEFAKAEQARAGVIKLPTLADIKRWLGKGLITPSEFSDRLDLLGYQTGDIELFLKEATT